MPDVRSICRACGTQYPASAAPPPTCPICDDERQYVPPGGQRWTSLAELRAGHRVEIEPIGPGVHALRVTPDFAIGERALLIETPHGNVLWDCIALIDAETVAWIADRGGLAAIAISHPHYYTTFAEWSDAFEGVPVYLHADDAEWVQMPHPSVRHWTGETLEIAADLTLVRCGGHYEGGTVLHWAAGDGVLFSGDILQVVMDRRHVSFMRSYPNLIPLDAGAVGRIAGAVAPYAFQTVHGGFPGRSIVGGGKAAVDRSVRRYLTAIGAVT